MAAELVSVNRNKLVVSGLWKDRNTSSCALLTLLTRLSPHFPHPDEQPPLRPAATFPKGGGMVGTRLVACGLWIVVRSWQEVRGLQSASDKNSLPFGEGWGGGF